MNPLWEKLVKGVGRGWRKSRSGLARAACVALISAAGFPVTTPAQQTVASGILSDGNAVATGFSGVQWPTLIQPGVDPADKATIDLNGASLRMIDLQAPGSAPQAQILTAPKPFTVTASQVGQVFGIALDNASPPNIYVAATSIYGLPIVVPDVDNDGIPDRWEQGAANARFMAGLFGPPQAGGGPGSIWRIDGATGAVRLFANVTLGDVPNGGPALGALAFDPVSNTLFAADRETGMIHRFDPSGAERGRYDHGLLGRPAAGLVPVPFDPSQRLVITRPPFQPANPDSWGYAPAPRRVFGLAVRDGRLHYAVAENLQIWSVTIAPDGSLGADARVEITVPTGAGASEISAIAFDGRGDMLLAERAAPTGAFNFAALTEVGGRVLRYARAPSATGPIWQPAADEYAIGFAAQMRGGNGGVAIGYGYDANGRINRNSCSGFAWFTGEQLRSAADATLATQLAQGGSPHVNGLQGNDIQFVRPADTSRQRYFVDYDDRFDDPNARGHLGNVAIFRGCARVGVAGLQQPMVLGAPGAAGAPPVVGAPAVAGGPALPGGVPPAGFAPVPVPVPVPGAAGAGGAGGVTFDLELKKAVPSAGGLGAGAGMLAAACTPGMNCRFEITVTNKGPGPYAGPLNLEDAMPAGWSFASAASPWVCQQQGVAFSCAHPPLTLASGQSVTMAVELQSVAAAGGQPAEVENCAEIDWKGSGDLNKANDRGCEKVMVGAAPSDLQIFKSGPKECARGTACIYTVKIVNAGKGSYQGPIVIEERNFQQAGLVLQSAGTTLAGCKDTALGKIDCDLGNVTLAPGASVDGFISVTLPAELDPKIDTLKDCVKITKSVGAVSKPESCFDTSLKADFDLKAAKHGPAKCYEPGPCTFTLYVWNVGSGDYEGPITLTESTQYPVELNSFKSSPPWTCTASAGKAAWVTYEVTCTHPWVKLQKATGIGGMIGLAGPLNLTLGLHDTTQTEFKNCAKVGYKGGKPDANPANDEVCITTPLEQSGGTLTGGAGPHWQLTLTGIGTLACIFSDCTDYEFTVANTGPSTYFLPTTLRVKLPEGARLRSARGTQSGRACLASGWSCEQSGQDLVCRHSDCALAKDEKTAVHFDLRLLAEGAPPPPKGTTKTVCGEIEWFAAPGTGAEIEQIATRRLSRACVTTRILVPDEATPRPACAPGYVVTTGGQCCLASQMTTNGVCCPQGQKPDSRRRTCVADTPGKPTIVPSVSPQPVGCPTGTVRAASGECCPRSQMTTRGICCPPVQRPDARRRACIPVAKEMPAVTPPAGLRCTGGKVPSGNICICPPGTIDLRGSCVRAPVGPAPSPPKCTGGKVPVGNRCECPANTREMRGLCVPIQQAPQTPQLQQIKPLPAQPKPATPQMQQLQIGPAKIICPTGTVWSEPNKRCLPVVQ
jgi:hypothetical protein